MYPEANQTGLTQAKWSRNEEQQQKKKKKKPKVPLCCEPAVYGESSSCSFNPFTKLLLRLQLVPPHQHTA